MKGLIKVRLYVFSFLFLVSTPHLKAQELTPSPQLILARFDVPKHGDALLLPVTFQDKTYQFVVDTGASLTVFDSSLPLGQVRQTLKAKSSHGDFNIQLYDRPKASLGKFALGGAPFVVGMDLSKIRAVSGHDIHGIIGMDFLSQQILHVDFHQGKLLFLKAAAPNLGKPFAISISPNGEPSISLMIPGWGKEEFLIDTGAVGCAGQLQSFVYQSLAKKNLLRTLDSCFYECASGNCEIKYGQLNSLTLGEFTLRELVLGENKNGSQLGLGFWSRFVMTLDFPNRTMYLGKSQSFANPDRWNRSGCSCICKEGKVIIETVKKDSPAARLGIKVGDILLQVGPTKVEANRLFELRKMLSVEDSALLLIIQSGEAVRHLSLEIKK